jgi:hypothetical protein
VPVIADLGNVADAAVLNGSPACSRVEVATFGHTCDVGVVMDLRFVGIDPDTGDGHCPAVFVDETTRDLVLQGWTITDPADLAQAAEHSPLGDDETVIRLPARMREIVLRALTEGHDDDGSAAVQ